MNNITVVVEQLDWQKVDNLIPTIIQDAKTLQVLMLGYMDKSALQQTLTTKQVTFYSRSKQRLWIKGETSGNFLSLIEIIPDCDNDTLLLLVDPAGPCCHLETTSCFDSGGTTAIGFIAKLETIIQQRHRDMPEDSYTTKLFSAGVQRMAQKVGEEGVEVALAAVSGDKKHITAEAGDLLYHLLVLLRGADIELSQVVADLEQRAHEEK